MCSQGLARRAAQGFSYLEELDNYVKERKVGTEEPNRATSEVGRFEPLASGMQERIWNGADSIVRLASREGRQSTS